MDPVEAAQRLGQLEDVEAIRQLKARYFRHVDAHEFDEVADLFWPDAQVRATSAMSGPAGEFVASLRELSARLTTFHAGHMPEIAVLPDGTATGRWSMSFHMQWTGEAGLEAAQGYRLYEDTYRKVDGEWRIAGMRITEPDANPMVAITSPAS
ncbi:nuclear transport factor 2 family protein [Nocardioides humi]|uniref:Nuclear transport factor 2 family protein n=1 Tax=Nocardioides humi TaxID=449461 RepID=A0ABN2BD64_9ACTN|nr:nuclear transport factor 2 family protein [Nocardioides humi]